MLKSVSYKFNKNFLFCKIIFFFWKKKRFEKIQRGRIGTVWPFGTNWADGVRLGSTAARIAAGRFNYNDRRGVYAGEGGGVRYAFFSLPGTNFEISVQLPLIIFFYLKIKAFTLLQSKIQEFPKNRTYPGYIHIRILAIFINGSLLYA